MRAASPLRQMERENEMIVISHLLFCCDGFSLSLVKYVRKMNTDNGFSPSLEMTMALNANSL